MKTILTILLTLLFISGCENTVLNIDYDSINRMKLNSQELPFDIHSREYMLVDLSDMQVMYADRHDLKMYPASLTKIVTLDVVLNLADDLYDLSHVTYDQVEDLISQDASLAYIQRDFDYTLKDLLYALVLPSGADGALALENYFSARGIDLVEQMNIQAEKLGCKSSHFVNTTGLHEDDHYTSLDDLFLFLMDILKFEDGREIMESLWHRLEDGTMVYTTMGVAHKDPDVDVLGGKTGYTPEAGQNIIVFYKNRAKSYVLLLGNAMGKYSNNEYWHFEDTLKIFEQLY